MSQGSGPSVATSTTGTRPRRRRWLLPAIGAAVVGGGVLVATLGSGPRDAQPSGAARARLDLAEVSRGDFEISTTATGELRARNQVEIRNQLDSDSTIVEIVPEGASVKKGDVLIRLNSENIQTRLDEQSLELENARAAVIASNNDYEIQVSENESARRAAELKLALAELDLNKWRAGEVKAKRQELAHTLDRTTKDEARLKEFYDRSKLLKEREFYSEDKLKQDQLAWEEAVAAKAKAQLASEIYEQYEYPKDERQKQSDVDEARAEVERVERQNASKLANKEADKKNKQRSLELREQKYQKDREQLAAATIKAPSDGLVVYSTSLESSRWGNDDGPLQVGSKVYPNQTLIVLPDTTEMIASVKVHESFAGRIHKGQPATIKIDAMSDKRFTGEVESVGILAEQTSRWMDPTLREYTVRIALNLPKDLDAPQPAGGRAGASARGLRPSMRCEAEIVMGKVSDALTVPIQAVHSEGLLRYVNLADGSGTSYSRRPVMIGRRSDRFAEVLAGVEPGDRVLLRKPEPSEIVGKGWNPKELAAVGLELNASGDIVPVAGAPGQGPSERAGGPRGPGRPGPKPGRQGPPGGMPAAPPSADAASKPAGPAHGAETEAATPSTGGGRPAHDAPAGTTRPADTKG